MRGVAGGTLGGHRGKGFGKILLGRGTENALGEAEPLRTLAGGVPVEPLSHGLPAAGMRRPIGAAWFADLKAEGFLTGRGYKTGHLAVR